MRVNKRKIRICILLGLILLLAVRLGARHGWWQPPASAENALSVATVEPDWSHGRLLVSNPEGESVYVWGVFRIIYYTQGEHAVPETDLNHNGIPDFVEDVALQLVVAHHIFCNLMGFPVPLNSSRYPGVQFVDFHIPDFFS